jgi:hypothetical protein
MDFRVIQQFFTKMQCQVCHAHLHTDGIELLKEENGTFLVNLHCTNCDTQMGVAVVSAEKASHLKDLMEEDLLTQEGTTVMLEVDKGDLHELLTQAHEGHALSGFDLPTTSLLSGLEGPQAPDVLASLLKGLQEGKTEEVPSKLGELIAQALAHPMSDGHDLKEDSTKEDSIAANVASPNHAEKLSPEKIRLQKARKRVRYPKKLYDPELTPQEKVRLEKFAPITDNDVLEAHHFFQTLGDGWQKLIPQEMRQSYK